MSFINQSVEDKLQDALDNIRQRVDEELATAQSRRAATGKEKGKGKALAAQNPDSDPGQTTPEQSTSGTRTRLWADIMEEEEEDALDLAVASDEELEPGRAKRPKLLEVSEETKAVVKEAFTSTLSNMARREIRSRAPGLDLPETRCPRLDSLYKTSESKFSANSDAKQVDGDLQKIQALMLDVAAPLLELKSVAEDHNPAARDPKEALDDAIRLLGNAIGQTSKIRRKRVLRTCNPNIQDLAEEEALFTAALPNLFGPEFEQKMKDRAESVKILAKSQNLSSQRGGSRVFRRGHHSQAQRGGGPPYRGGRDHYPGNFRNPFVFRGRNKKGGGAKRQ